MILITCTFWLTIFLILGLDYLLLKKAEFSTRQAILYAIAAELNFIFWGTLIASGGAYLNLKTYLNIILILSIVGTAILLLRIAIAFYLLRKSSASNTYGLIALLSATALIYFLSLSSYFIYSENMMAPPRGGVVADQLAMGRVVQSLQLYRIHNHHYPTTAMGLEALLTEPPGARNWRGPYIEKEKMLDPLGRPFRYISDGRTLSLRSVGVDKQFDTADDALFPKP